MTFEILDEYWNASPLSASAYVRASVPSCANLCLDPDNCPCCFYSLNILVMAGTSSGAFHFVPICASGTFTITISITLPQPSGTLTATQTETIM